MLIQWHHQRPICAIVGNNPVVPDPSREQIDLNQESNFTTDAGGARSEIRSTTCTDNAPRQEDSNTPDNDDSTSVYLALGAND